MWSLVQVPPPPAGIPDWLMWVFYGLAVFAFVLMTALYLLKGRKTQDQGLDRSTITSQSDALKARDLTIMDYEKKIRQMGEDLESARTELMGLAGISQREVLIFAEKGLMAELARIKVDHARLVTEAEEQARHIRALERDLKAIRGE